jgi:hypothetical protein
MCDFPSTAEHLVVMLWIRKEQTRKYAKVELAWGGYISRVSELKRGELAVHIAGQVCVLIDTILINEPMYKYVRGLVCKLSPILLLINFCLNI